MRRQASNRRAPNPGHRSNFNDALTKLEAIKVTPVSLGTAFQAAALWQALVRQYGGDLTDPEGKTATYNSDAGVKALEKIKELRDKIHARRQWNR